VVAAVKGPNPNPNADPNWKGGRRERAMRQKAKAAARQSPGGSGRIHELRLLERKAQRRAKELEIMLANKQNHSAKAKSSHGQGKGLAAVIMEDSSLITPING